MRRLVRLALTFFAEPGINLRFIQSRLCQPHSRIGWDSCDQEIGKVPDEQLREMLGMANVTFKQIEQRLAIIDPPLQF